jgi:Tol biopolymer transport system component
VSTDGRNVVFISRRDGNSEVYQMGIDGSDQRRLTKTSARESSPHLLPNRDVVYVVEHSKGSNVMRLPSSGSEGIVLLQTEQPIAALAVSGNGERIAYVVGKIADVRKGKAQFRLFLQSLGSRSAAVPVALRPGEQILSPSF